MMEIKVCGMRDSDNIRAVSELGVDYIGLIFWEKSPRNVTMIPTHAGIIPDRGSLTQPSASVTEGQTSASYPTTSPKRVGVFVNEMAQNIITRVVNYQLDIVQLHGQESPTLIRNLRATLSDEIRPTLRYWKAISISDEESITGWHHYEDCIDGFVFDTKCITVGGSGRQIDWSVLEAYDGDKPFLLSGGIGPDDMERIKAFRHPMFRGIDLNSRFETSPGVKDVDSLKRFLSALRQ